MKKHKIVLRLLNRPDEKHHEVVFQWETDDAHIIVKFLEASGMYRTSEMHRPDARVIWGDLISKGYEIIDDSKYLQWNSQNIWNWEQDD